MHKHSYDYQSWRFQTYRSDWITRYDKHRREFFRAGCPSELGQTI